MNTDPNWKCLVFLCWLYLVGKAIQKYFKKFFSRFKPKEHDVEAARKPRRKFNVRYSGKHTQKDRAQDIDPEKGMTGIQIPGYHILNEVTKHEKHRKTTPIPVSSTPAGESLLEKRNKLARMAILERRNRAPFTCKMAKMLVTIYGESPIRRYTDRLKAKLSRNLKKERSKKVKKRVWQQTGEKPRTQRQSKKVESALAIVIARTMNARPDMSARQRRAQLKALADMILNSLASPSPATQDQTNGATSYEANNPSVFRCQID